MTKEELITQLEKAKRQLLVAEHEDEREFAQKKISNLSKELSLLTQNSALINNSNLSEKDSVISPLTKHNVQIIDSFYKNNQTFVTKEDLIDKGFEFVEFFSTSDLKPHFDNKENIFEYKDFNCGNYFIKTRDKNLENPSQTARIFFQIIKINLDNERINSELKLAIKLLSDRKYAYGSYHAASFDRDLENETISKNSKEKLDALNKEINRVLPRIKMIIDSYKINHDLFVDLYERLQKENSLDEKWL